MARLFDRINHIGLRHLAIRLADVDTLERIHQTLAEADEVGIEFSPEPLRGGPNTHMVCYEPGGIRIEFIAAGWFRGFK